MCARLSTPLLRKQCDQLALDDKDLQAIIHQYGYPPLWQRPNSFETLVHIILEQQVSLASTKAALEKLRLKVGHITPQNVLTLSDEHFREAYFSRQKTSYARHLATAIDSNDINLKALEKQPDDDVRDILTQLKGIGDWTVDIYLIMVLGRQDVFPTGDLAAVKAARSIKGLDTASSRDEVLSIATEWQPYRTAATMILWHYYLQKHK